MVLYVVCDHKQINRYIIENQIDEFAYFTNGKKMKERNQLTWQKMEKKRDMNKINERHKSNSEV